MVEFFIKNRRGSITVMLTCILIAVMSLNTTIIEVARFKSMERLYKEIEENAAFSVLSLYDRDLYENYGLLAISQEVNEATLYSFITENMNGNLQDANGRDKMLTLSEENLSMDKIYTLAEDQVFKSQVNEFCVYRAPIDLVDKALNIEATLDELIKKLKDILPMLEVFREATKFLDKLVTAFGEAYKFTKATEEVVTAEKNYNDSVDTYNAAVNARDAHINSYNPPSYEINGESENEVAFEEFQAAHAEYHNWYHSELDIKCGEVTQNAANVKLKIGDLRIKLIAQVEAYDNFVGAFEDLLSAEVDTILGSYQAKARGEAKEATENVIKEMRKAYEDSESAFEVVRMGFEKFRNEKVDATQARLSTQSASLNGDGRSLQSTNKETIGTIDFMEVYVEELLVFAQQIEGFFDKWGEVVGTLKEVIETLKYLYNLGLSDVDYNNVIKEDVFNVLPGKQRNGTLLVTASNPYSADEVIKNDWVDSEFMEEIAGAVHFESDILHVDDEAGENGTLISAMEAVQDNWYALQVYLHELTWVDYVIGQIGIIIDLGDLIEKFLTSVIDLINAFIACGDGATLAKVLYQKIYAAEYAVEMFSNRTTNLSEDERLNGSSFSNYKGRDSASEYVFDQANAEYIVHGSNREQENQSRVFLYMLCIRMVANIYAVFTDKAVMAAVAAANGFLPIIGGIAVRVAYLFVEAYIDMFFLINTDKGVDIIKEKCWVNLTTGAKDLLNQVKAIIKDQELYENTSSLVNKSKTRTVTEESKKSEQANNVNQSISGDSGGETDKKVESTGSSTGGEADKKAESTGSSTGGETDKKAESTGNSSEGETDKKAESTGNSSGGETDKKAESADNGSGEGQTDEASKDKNNNSEKNENVEEEEGTAVDKFVTDYGEGLMKWDYKDHMMLLLSLFVSRNKIYARCADLIEMDLKQAKRYGGDDEEFKLSEMATYIRVESAAEYEPLLPVPIVPGLNDKTFKIENFHYNGY